MSVKPVISKADLHSSELLAALQKWAKDHVSELVSLAEAVHRVGTGPEFAGFEAHFVDLGMPQYEARIIAFLLPKFARQLELQRIAERAASSYLREIAAGGSSLKLSRRAQALQQQSLHKRPLKGAIDRACTSASCEDFWLLIDRASYCDEAACVSLAEAASMLVKELPKPQGRPFKPENLMHEILLFLRDDMGLTSGYTCREHPTDLAGHEFSDPQTRATCKALGLKYFNPTSARRNLKKHIAKRPT